MPVFIPLFPKESNQSCTTYRHLLIVTWQSELCWKLNKEKTKHVSKVKFIKI
jgi:hypothetical protein